MAISTMTRAARRRILHLGSCDFFNGSCDFFKGTYRSAVGVGQGVENAIRANSRPSPSEPPGISRTDDVMQFTVAERIFNNFGAKSSHRCASKS
jgi:hypothetical protein